MYSTDSESVLYILSCQHLQQQLSEHELSFNHWGWSQWYYECLSNKLHLYGNCTKDWEIW